MTVLLEFRSPSTTARRFGPLSGFTIDREFLRDYPAGSVLAIHQWKDKSQMSNTFGPYDAVSIFDGVYLGTQVFASMDERQDDWFSHEDGRHWPVMVAESPTK